MSDLCPKIFADLYMCPEHSTGRKVAAQLNDGGEGITKQFSRGSTERRVFQVPAVTFQAPQLKPLRPNGNHPNQEGQAGLFWRYGPAKKALDHLV